MNSKTIISERFEKLKKISSELVNLGHIFLIGVVGIVILYSLSASIHYFYTQGFIHISYIGWKAFLMLVFITALSATFELAHLLIIANEKRYNRFVEDREKLKAELTEEIKKEFKDGRSIKPKR